MYEVSVEQHFDAAHYLRGYRGKCESLHGHRYRVVVSVTCPQLDDIGLAYDFAELKRYLREILARFDHTCLNDVPPFTEINPSSENIALTIYNELQPRLPGGPVSLSSIEVWESPESRIVYRP
jgi:6-pyruvoyltetrahydropterin/6-carboxytetrahydropterin synthase